MKIIIRKERKTDFEAVYQLNIKAFGGENESKLIELLRKSDAFIPDLSLVAKVENKIVGHILFSKIIIINEKGEEYNSLALAPMAVLPYMQNRGIGGKLIYFGLNIAREIGFKSVIVLGHENYYPKFGFKPASMWKIKAPFIVPDKAFMAIELVDNGLSGISGIVQYPKEFELV